MSGGYCAGAELILQRIRAWRGASAEVGASLTTDVALAGINLAASSRLLGASGAAEDRTGEGSSADKNARKRFYCDKPGHAKKDCRKKKGDGEKRKRDAESASVPQRALTADRLAPKGEVRFCRGYTRPSASSGKG